MGLSSSVWHMQGFSRECASWTEKLEESANLVIDLELPEHRMGSQSLSGGKSGRVGETIELWARKC